MDKRSFLKTTAALGALPFSGFALSPQPTTISSPLPKVTDATLWETVRTHYTLTQDYINLESGYYNIIPNPTLERLQQHLQRVNYEGRIICATNWKKTEKICGNNSLSVGLCR